MQARVHSVGGKRAGGRDRAPAAVRQGDGRKSGAAGGKAGRGQVVVGGAEKGPEGCGAGSLPQGRGRGRAHPGGQEPAKEGLLGFLFVFPLSFISIAINNPFPRSCPDSN